MKAKGLCQDILLDRTSYEIASSGPTALRFNISPGFACETPSLSTHIKDKQKTNPAAGEMALLVQCFPHKHRKICV